MVTGKCLEAAKTFLRYWETKDPYKHKKKEDNITSVCSAMLFQIHKSRWAHAVRYGLGIPLDDCLLYWILRLGGQIRPHVEM